MNIDYQKVNNAWKGYVPFNENYKGYKYDLFYIDGFLYFYLLDYKDKKFLTEEAMRNYVDKVIMRKKKLERLKLI